MILCIVDDTLGMCAVRVGHKALDALSDSDEP